MTKKRVGILCGGQSVEHEVSLQSAKNIVEAIDKQKYEVVLIAIDKQGGWHLNNTSDFLINTNFPSLSSLNKSNTSNIVLVFSASKRLSLYQTFIKCSKKKLLLLDIIFPILHGPLGEDGCIQGLLRLMNIPFVGSDILGSAINMDKDCTKRLLRDAGIKVTPWVCITKTERPYINVEELVDRFGLPLFIKPVNQGSSIGVSKVDTIEMFNTSLELAFSFDSKIIIEKNIQGREIECAILGNAFPQASPCGEIIAKDAFYSYKTKYINPDDVQLVIPAVINDAVSQKIRSVAIKAFRILECTGMARVDIFLTETGDIIVNEVNTLPGFTDVSMYPKLWQVAGISYRDLITRLLELAEEYHQHKYNIRTSI
ncbi:D-alanine--D-alanine ligase [Candidatus Pantoea carbekii]|uniref:D-alanine--D-alanine ligase n=1 Tax=Candidatus Pantoea carbekii TaxID=1235990 RepID=U3U7L9_9GAMM|nr:D-alanine--D-alanine ligase [Candidatus Pantoea carbekii]AKC32541.1 D-alanine--D-alanine ligase A DdlA [Candidatus Pantoea carbekii]BAO00269.1 hypothetical protein HHS_02990 [Candidatus Pantoea carbekii]